MNQKTQPILLPPPESNILQYPVNPLDAVSLMLQALIKLEENDKAHAIAIENLANKIDKSAADAKQKKRFYTVKEAMIELNRSDKAIYDLVKRGLLKTDNSTGGKLLIPAKEIETLAERAI